MTDAFAPGPSQPAAAPLFSGAALLDAERLDVYRVALEFQAVAGPLIPKRGGQAIAPSNNALQLTTHG
jgi:hypothetical protein